MTILGKQPIVAFVATTIAERAKEFYAGTLGLQLLADEPYALVFDAAGVMLRVAKVSKLVPQQHTVLGWKVPDIAGAVRALEAAGVVFERYPGMPQDELGVCTFPGGGRVAWFKDPDGNTLSLTEFGS